jgi:peptide/nickel transport system substrate-binding protein
LKRIERPASQYAGMLPQGGSTMMLAPLTRRQLMQGATAGVMIASLPRVLKAQQGGILRVRSNRDLQVLDPGWMIGGMEIDLQYTCLPSLTVYSLKDGKLGWVPSDFVERVELVNPTRIEFTLKPGFKWSGDFGEFTTEDVKYSYERIADPKKDAPWKDKWKTLDHVEVTDKYKGAIVLKEPFAPLFVTTLCDGPGSIVCKAATEKAGGKFETSFPAICGPYAIKNWVPKQRVELTLNPLWSGPKPDFPEVHFIIVEDEKASELAYEAGDLDITTISEETFARYQKSPPAGSKLMVAFNNNWSWLGMNTENPKLKDKRVREAIQNAIDVESCLTAAYNGLAPRARGIVLPGLPGHRDTTKFEKPNPDKARQLLQEAGVSGLELDLKTLPDTDKITMAQVIQANLEDVGIKVNVIPTDPGPFWNLGLESKGNDWKDLQLYIQEFGDSPDPSQMAQWYVGEQVGIWNWERWKDPEFDKLYAEALRESDPEKRGQMYIRMQEIMEDTGAYVWLAFKPAEKIYRDWMQPVIVPGDHPYTQWFKKA